MPSASPRHSFLTTRWSVVHRAAAGAGAEPNGEAALAQLCAACWFSIYAYIRRSGKSAHDAEDLTQGFFARLLKKNFLASADGDKGRLRTFVAMESLRARYAAEGKLAIFEKLRPFLGFSADAAENYVAVTTALGLKLNTVKSHIRRLREEWRDLLQQQVAATLDEPTPQAIKAELAALIACV